MAVITGSFSILGSKPCPNAANASRTMRAPDEVDQVPFRKIWMGFDLHHCGLDPRGRDDLLHLLQTDI
jgi:hypothetical protein